MVKVQDLMDHIVTEVGVSSDAAYPFKAGYMISLLEDLQLRYPAVQEVIASHARRYNFQNN